MQALNHVIVLKNLYRMNKLDYKKQKKKKKMDTVFFEILTF